MNAASHPVNFRDYSALALPAEVIASDATFYLPLVDSKANGGTLTITLTSEERSRNEAQELINRRYAWRGYGSNHKLAGRQHETIFTARFDGMLVGTITLAADSDRGLSVDTTFPEEMQFFRRKQNTRLCELTKLAMECSSPSKPLLAALFHFVFVYGTNNYLGSDLLIEINPRHAPFYEKMLGFQRNGAVRMNKSVNAPSVLMSLSVDDIETAINNRDAARYNSTLYKYFYPRAFEDRIINELNYRGLRENSLLANY